jgi:hypothetical protein
MPATYVAGSNAYLPRLPLGTPTLCTDVAAEEPAERIGTAILPARLARAFGRRERHAIREQQSKHLTGCRHVVPQELPPVGNRGAHAEGEIVRTSRALPRRPLPCCRLALKVAHLPLWTAIRSNPGAIVASRAHQRDLHRRSCLTEYGTQVEGHGNEARTRRPYRFTLLRRRESGLEGFVTRS